MMIYDNNNVSIIANDYDKKKHLHILSFMLNFKIIRESNIISILKKI